LDYQKFTFSRCLWKQVKSLIEARGPKEPKGAQETPKQPKIGFAGLKIFLGDQGHPGDLGARGASKGYFGLFWLPLAPWPGPGFLQGDQGHQGRARGTQGNPGGHQGALGTLPLLSPGWPSLGTHGLQELFSNLLMVRPFFCFFWLWMGARIQKGKPGKTEGVRRKHIFGCFGVSWAPLGSSALLASTSDFTCVFFLEARGCQGGGQGRRAREGYLSAK
jgi:hypothetical protein